MGNSEGYSKLLGNDFEQGAIPCSILGGVFW